MKAGKEKRVLIISNNCFSKKDSNGRTLAGFFKNYPKDKLAQFYIQNATPDFDVCNNYFRVTDSEVLSAFFKKKSVGKRVQAISEEKIENKVSKKRKRTPFTLLVREMVWNSRKWNDGRFDCWIKEFNPELVLIQAGDSAFMLKIAREIAMEYNIPLVMYNSENYYFKKKNYLKDSGITTLLYPVFIRKFRKQFDKAINYAAGSIYSCEGLKNLYDEKFYKASTAIYTSSNIIPKVQSETKRIPKISYLGNLGVGRHEPLIEIAQTLQELNRNYYLDIYGKFPNKEVEGLMLNCSGIRYQGFVGYEEVVNVMKESDFLVHAENFSEFYIEDLKYAFSTKIADSLSCGTCLFYYASKEIESTKYLLKNKAAYVVTEKESLKTSLKELIENPKEKEFYEKNALQVAQSNHNQLKNIEKFYGFLNNCYKG